MTRRCITRARGAAAGGLLGTALLPVATAFADDYEIVPVPGSTETVTGLYGLELTASPDEAGSVQGYQEFEVLDTTTSKPVGTFYADEANVRGDTLGETNQELLVIPNPDPTVDPATYGTVGTAAGDTPPVGSVIDTYGDSGFGYIYSDLASTTGTNTITETLVTPFGDSAIPTTFDAVAGLAADASDPTLQDITLAGGYEIVPESKEAITAISGLPPYDVAVQGTETFEVKDASGDPVGTFDADVTSTSDAVGFSTQALLVTSDDGSTNVGTAAGDVPAVGSVFNTIEYGDAGTPIYTDVYSDLSSASGDVITNNDSTPFGDFPFPTNLDAAAAASPRPAFTIGDGSTIVAAPGSTETFTGVNGLPPYDVAVQGTQEFDVLNASGVVGTFDADVSTSSTSQGVTDETLLVTSDGTTGTVGTAAGDVPAVGSMFDTFTYGDSGFETVYSDLVPTTPGADVVSEILVTPFGDFTLPNMFDAAAGLAADMFSGT